MSYDELAKKLASGATPERVEVLKRSPVRCVARTGTALVKVFLKRPERAAREANALARAAERGVPVPELLDSGAGWLAQRFLPGREARRDDLDRVLPVVRHMHDTGMLHGDLHLGNVWLHDDEIVLLDVQRARFLWHVPGVLRRRELGYLAYSAGDPLPDALAHVRFWRDVRAQRHWRSRTKRCVMESSRFTAFQRGFRRSDCDPHAIRQAISAAAVGEGHVLKDGPRTRLFRQGDWIVKRHASKAKARAAWIGACGLEARGIGCARALAWHECWLVMEDAGPTLTDWVEEDFARATADERDELAETCAGLLADLHRRGVYHADLKANNVCWTPGREPRLLDYGEVRFGWRVSRRRRIKNLAQLNAALPDVVPGALRHRALSRYFERAGLDRETGVIREKVIRESLARGHRWTGCGAERPPSGPERAD